MRGFCYNQSMNTLVQLRSKVKQLRNPDKAKILSSFFKTGKGQYGEGDVFYGLTVPICRSLAKQYSQISSPEITELLKSQIHEERLIALLLLVHNFQKGDVRAKEKIYNFYLKSTRHINNWDLVDLSADKIAGIYWLEKFTSPSSSPSMGGNRKISSLPRHREHSLISTGKARYPTKNSLFGEGARRAGEVERSFKHLLDTLLSSSNIWERRIAVLTTFSFIKHYDFFPTLYVCEKLLADKHDLIHKATGWMLREMGKRDIKPLEEFLNSHSTIMPRTMLRYAIEKLPDTKRKYYLAK